MTCARCLCSAHLIHITIDDKLLGVCTKCAAELKRNIPYRRPTKHPPVKARCQN